MTTPQTPAGWYSDPGGSGGQRYWDGYTWTEHQAGGAEYSADSEATFYTGGGAIGVNPGDQADIAVAFDVPPGTAPEAIELHGDPMSPGVEVPLP